jgi:hypothetical protein
VRNSSTRSLKFAYSPPAHPVISVQIGQACAQQPHSTKVKDQPQSLSRTAMPDDFLKTSVKNANHDSTYLILGLLVTSICNPGLVDPYIDESSLPCVSPSLLDPGHASDCKAAFEDVHPVTGLSSKRSSLRPGGVNKVETIIKQSIFVTV